MPSMPSILKFTEVSSHIIIFDLLQTPIKVFFMIEYICLRVYAAWIRSTEDDEADSRLGCVFVLQE